MCPNEMNSATDHRPPTTTSKGTPCAQSWTDDWIARVEQREEELGRRICGARTIGHGPCPAVSTHPSGRCGHHGGFDLTGAPDGNRNAAVHFLYARRLMPCGQHCPAWQSCPLGGGGPDRGREMAMRAPADRPTCPFEQAEYTAVVTDALRRTQNHHENAWGLHLAHQVALMTIMVSRAARALAVRGFTDTAESYQGEHLVLSERPAAALIAYEKLARELRRWTILLERGYEWISCDPTTAAHHKHRQTSDIFPDPDSITKTATDPNLGGRASSRAAEEHREPNDQNQKDQSNGESKAVDLSVTSEPSVVKQNGVSDRIQNLITSVVPKPTPQRISDPPGTILNLGLSP